MYRHGELIIRVVKEVKGKKRNNLILAEGEATGHKHEITTGDAELYDENGTLYLSVKSEAELTHQDHDTITLPKGNYEITIQKEYVVGEDKYRKVSD
jgi:hypothetical protein